ncbi:hypothetical protein BN1723_018554, partial [Verticillium longisporum]
EGQEGRGRPQDPA